MIPTRTGGQEKHFRTVFKGFGFPKKYLSTGRQEVLLPEPNQQGGLAILVPWGRGGVGENRAYNRTSIFSKALALSGSPGAPCSQVQQECPRALVLCLVLQEAGASKRFSRATGDVTLAFRAASLGETGALLFSAALYASLPLFQRHLFL